MLASRCRAAARSFLCALALGTLGACASAPCVAPDPVAETAAQFERVRGDPEQLRAFLSAMPVGGDLHHHLSGSATPEMILDIAIEDGLCVPRDPAREWRLERPPCGAGLRPASDARLDPALRAEMLRRWSMRAYPTDDPSVVRSDANDHFFSLFGTIREANRDLGRLLAGARRLAAQSGTRYLETSTGWEPDRDALDAFDATPLDADLLAMRRALLANPQFTALRDAIVTELPRQLARSEQLLGCATASPDPGCEVEVRFQRVAVRSQPPGAVFVEILLAYEIAQRSEVVVGINFVAPETDAHAIRDYALHMRMLGELAHLYPDVKRSLHAGEMGVAQAIALGARDHIALAIAPVEAGGAAAQRIGHGVSLDAETSRNAVLERMRQQSIAIEINLRSNALLLGVTGAAHPFDEYLAAGVPIVLATDDAGLMGADLREQFALAAAFPEVDYRTLKQLARNSLRYSFLPASDRERLASQLEAALDAFESSWQRDAAPLGAGLRRPAQCKVPGTALNSAGASAKP
ncbi:MAG TPA: adenosine deaminase [Myxococcota bacterium]|nr:adenosine deaminase [Myxococcota bacterium]